MPTDPQRHSNPAVLKVACGNNLDKGIATSSQDGRDLLCDDETCTDGQRTRDGESKTDVLVLDHDERTLAECYERDVSVQSDPNGKRERAREEKRGGGGGGCWQVAEESCVNRHHSRAFGGAHSQAPHNAHMALAY